MSNFILFLQEGDAFDLESLCKILSRKPGIRRQPKGLADGNVDTYHYDSSTMGTGQVSVLADGSAVWVDDEYQSCLEFCLWLQSQYPSAIFIVNESYLFHLRLADFATVELLDAAIVRGDIVDELTKPE
jgi:hypothetical protein